MLAKNRQKFAKLPNQKICSQKLYNSPDFRNLVINSPIWQPWCPSSSRGLKINKQGKNVMNAKHDKGSSRSSKINKQEKNVTIKLTNATSNERNKNQNYNKTRNSTFKIDTFSYYRDGRL